MKDIKTILQALGMVERLKKAGMLNPLTARLLLDAYSGRRPVGTDGNMSEGTTEGKQESKPETLKAIETLATVSELFSSPFDMPDESVSGPIRIGFTENKLPVGLYPEECHVLIAGQTGSGKSTLLKLIFAQAILAGNIYEPDNTLKAWIFAKAHDMRSLLGFSEDILVATFNEIKLNPLEPPCGMEAVEWAGVFSDLWTQAFRLYEGSKGFLIECLNKLYSNYARHGYYPCLLDLYDYVSSLKFPAISRTARYQESVLNRLSGLIKGSLGGVFDCSRGHTSGLLNTNTIFEIPYLTTEEQVFIVNYLLSYLFYYKLLNETGLRHFVAIDDANLIFDASFEKRADLGLPVIHHLLTTVRKNRINIFAATQTPHQLGASIHSNAFAKVMLSLSNGRDIDFMQQSMGIKSPEQRVFCYKLKPCMAVVKFSSRYQDPFIMTIPEVWF